MPRVGARDTSNNHDGVHLPPRNLLRWFVMPDSLFWGFMRIFVTDLEFFQGIFWARDFSVTVL